MCRQAAVPIAARKRRGEVPLVSRHVRLVCSSSIATPSARGIIGRSIKHSANNVLPSNAMRPSSRTHRSRRIVPFASYRCLYEFCRVFHFHPRLFFPFQLTTLQRQMKMRSWLVWARNDIMHVAEKLFVECAYTLSNVLTTIRSVHFAIPTEVTKRLLSMLKI